MVVVAVAVPSFHTGLSLPTPETLKILREERRGGRGTESYSPPAHYISMLVCCQFQLVICSD
jgi:hypothetical protein